MSGKVLIVLTAAGLIACAGTPRVTTPLGSPASAREPESPPAEVLRALQEDPPLPGDAAEGWPGLADPREADAPQPEGHHHDP